jgi:5-methylcytosine-specific restriction endonuclease McrA
VKKEQEDKIKEFQRAVWAFWCEPGSDTPPCLLCWKPAATLHEIVPRSLYPLWHEDVLNSVPLCAECHERVHRNRAGFELELIEKRDQRMKEWMK